MLCTNLLTPNFENVIFFLNFTGYVNIYVLRELYYHSPLQKENQYQRMSLRQIAYNCFWPPASDMFLSIICDTLACLI